MNTTKIICAIAASLLLTACGGGGSAAPEELEPALAGPVATAYGDGTWMTGAIEHASSIIGREVINKSTGDDRSSPGDRYYGAMTGGPAVVLLGWGINDQWAVDETVMQYISYSRLSRELKAAGKLPIIVESTPIVVGGTQTGVINPWGKQRNEAARLRTEAIKRRVSVDVGVYYCAMPAREWALADKPDGINPSPEAAKWLGAVIAGCVKSAQ